LVTPVIHFTSATGSVYSREKVIPKFAKINRNDSCGWCLILKPFYAIPDLKVAEYPRWQFAMFNQKNTDV